MKVNLPTTLTFAICLILPQCFATKKELVQLLRGIAESPENDQPAKFKPMPPSPDDGLVKKATDSKACGDYADVRDDLNGEIRFPPGSPNGGDYDRWSDCGWVVQAPSSSSQITITFTYVNIEELSSCDDYVVLYKGTRASPASDYSYTYISEKMCPDSLSSMDQKTFITSAERVYVKFESDWWTQKKGFVISYRVTGGSSSDISCNFDGGNMCGWTNVAGNAVAWIAQQGSKSKWKSWGKVDYTTGGGSGYYAYLYTNGHSQGQGGKLTSPQLSVASSGGRCLTFFYNMLQTTGVFKVIMKYNDGTSQTVLHRDGSQGNGWFKGTVSLESKRPYSIIFEHIRGGQSVETGVAIDDISVSNQQCPSRLNSCGTNIYGSRKKRDLRSLLKSILEEKEKKETEEKKENTEEKEKTETEEKKENLVERIIGGQTSKKGQFPWIAHLRIYTGGVSSGRYSQCGGSIIDDEWILTAAHCFEKDGYTYTDPNLVRIYLGEHNTHYGEVEESQVVLIPEKVIMHPDRNAKAQGLKGHRNDLTLLKLKYKLTFTDDINSVCLPTAIFYPGMDCVAAGWGLAESGSTSQQLLHLSKQIESDGDCTYSITQDMICAIAPSGVADVCQGDSGGPLVCKRSNKYELAGAVSFGDTCVKRQRTSGVYADIYYFMPWIKSTIE